MSKRLKELQQRLHDLKTEGDALWQKADDENDGVLSEEMETRLTEIEAEIEEIKPEKEALEEQQKRREQMESVRAAPPPNQGNQGSAAQLSGQNPGGPSRVTSDEPNPDTTGGFRSVADFARAVQIACTPETAHNIDPRLTRNRGVRAAPGDAGAEFHEGAGSSGEGFELPVQYRDEIWQLVFQMQDLMMDVDLEPTSARQIEWVADETTPWGSSGVQAFWRAEGGQMTASKMQTKGRNLALHEIYAFVLATEELLEDAPRLNSRLTTKSAQAINWKISDAIVQGTGAGQPLGWFNSDAMITVAKEGGQAADTLQAENILKMYSRLLVAPGDTPYWLANRDVVPQLATMTIGDQPVWMPPNALMSAPGGILLGYPVRFSEHAQTLGDKGDIQLVSPLGYYAARRTQGVQFASSMHLYFDYNIEAFRWTFRFGGQPHLSAPVDPANGNNTKSHFVAMAERS